MKTTERVKKKIFYYLNSKLPRYPYRRYNDENKCIFIHIPKTAGTSILECLNAPTTGRQHIEYFHYERADKERFEQYLKFAIVRDPIDRAKSTYKYLLEGGNHDEADTYLSEQIRKGSNCFSEFVINVLTPSNVACFNFLRPQSAFICSFKDEIKVDSVLFFESLESDWKRLNGKFASVFKALPHINKSISSDDRELMLSSEAFSRIKLVYERDYKNFYSKV